MKTSKELDAVLNATETDALKSIMELMKSHGDTTIPIIMDDSGNVPGDEDYDDCCYDNNRVYTFAIENVSYEIYLTELTIVNGGQGFEMKGMDEEGNVFDSMKNDDIDTPVSVWVDILGAVERYYGKRDNK